MSQKSVFSDVVIQFEFDFAIVDFIEDVNGPGAGVCVNRLEVEPG